jgi:hypothetical protein
MKLVPQPLACGFFLLCFGGCSVKAIHVALAHGFRFAR